MFGGHRLFVLLSILFDMFIRFSFLGLYFVSLVKCKTVNLSDVNNYRAIAMSNTISKYWSAYYLKILKVMLMSTGFNLVLRSSVPLLTVLLY